MSEHSQFEGNSNTESMIHLINEHISALESGSLAPSGPTPDLAVTTLIEDMKKLRKEISSNRAITPLQVAAAYGAIYTKIVTSRAGRNEAVNKLRNFYIVDVIASQFVDDALTPQIGTGDILSISSENEKIQNEIDILNERFSLDSLATAVAEELVFYGDYYFATKVVPNPSVSGSGDHEQGISPIPTRIDKPESSLQEEMPNTPAHIPIRTSGTEYGLLEIRDDVDQDAIFAISDFTTIRGYITRNGDKAVFKEPADFIKFSLSPQRLRIDLHNELGLKKEHLDQVTKEIPRWARVGRSIMYPILSKLKELELLEALIPATKLSKLSSGSIIGVRVPTSMDIKDVKEFTDTVESLINRKIGIDPTSGELSVANIMATAGKTKVVPMWGENGTLTKTDVRGAESDDLQTAVLDLRQTILESTGIPVELVYSIRDERKRADSLKRYARYLRKLKQLQNAIKEGILQIIYIHLANKGIPFTTKEISVTFYNKLIEIDNLDRLEFMDTTVGLLKNAKDFVDELAEQFRGTGRINYNGFLKLLNEQLAVVGIDDFFMNIDNLQPGNILDTEGGTQPEPPSVEEPGLEPEETPDTKDAGVVADIATKLSTQDTAGGFSNEPSQ